MCGVKGKNNVQLYYPINRLMSLSNNLLMLTPLCLLQLKALKPILTVYILFYISSMFL